MKAILLGERRTTPALARKAVRCAAVPLLLMLAVEPGAAAQADEAYKARAEAKAQALLNDLSSRRRVTKLFANHQSVFHGVQESFVNTSAGNLTFLDRDLVAVGAMPIVAGRVYDSALEEDGDFGPGWKLTLREEIVRNGSQLAFTEASNTTYALVVDGAAIKPMHPASTPVRSGELAEDGAIVLRSLGLTRRFEIIDGVYRLVRVWHASGSVRLTYRGSRIESAASKAATVRFERRADGRIVAVRDGLGRAATYAYDGAGRLAEARDLAGAAWRYRYEAGGLAAIDDPRDETILHATYDAAGRVSWIEVQGVKSAFAYRQTTTRAVDGLSRTTVFHRAKSGVTEGVESPSGTFSRLVFDAAGRPVEARRDGVTIASLGYDAEGRLAMLRRAGGDTRLQHGVHGLTRVAGIETASYGYDGAGRLVAADDAGGVRRYGYDAGGFPNRIELGSWKTALRHDANGQTTRLSRGGRTLVAYVYRPDGRVESVAHGEKAGAAVYTYDQHGLRETASYGGGVDSAMRYDAAGNLIRYAVETPRGKRSQEYELGNYNQVLRIRNGGAAPGPDMTVRYDEAGRAFAVQVGRRTSTASYDALDRVTRVTLDGETVADYAYGALDQDVVAAADRRSGETRAPFGLSGVFGTMDSVAYTRPRPAAHAAVVYSPALKTFEATWRHLAPDALSLAGLRRRDLPVRGGAPNPAPFGHDRPSNSLFLPPEYSALNCYVCSGSVQSVVVRVGAAEVGRAVDVHIVVASTCSQGVGYDGPGPSLRNSWFVTLSYGDGTPAERFQVTGLAARRSHVYQSAGTYEVRAAVDCGCNSPAALLASTATATVEDCGGITAITAPSPDPLPIDTSIMLLTESTQAALDCLRTAVKKNGGMLTVNSAFRSRDYQAHLREVWDKYQTVEHWPLTRCAAVGDNVRTEWGRHNLAYRPAAQSPHSDGNAFDANWGTLNDGVTIDALAQGCNLRRPLPQRDRTHFVH